MCTKETKNIALQYVILVTGNKEYHMIAVELESFCSLPFAYHPDGKHIYLYGEVKSEYVYPYNAYINVVSWETMKKVL